MWWNTDNVILGLLQALCVLLPGAGLPAWLARRRQGRARAWSLLLPVSLVGTVVVIGAVPWSAEIYTWVALIGVPAGAAVALGWALRGAPRTPAAVVAGVCGAGALLAIKWVQPDAWIGQLAGSIAIMLSAVALGRLLAGAAPLTLLKGGLVAMALLDAWLVFGGHLQGPNALLNAAVPAPGLPRLQAGELGASRLGYGDFLAAAVLGGIAAASRWPQAPLALLLLTALLAWDQLFLIFDTLPATVPPAIVLLVWEGWLWRGGGGRRRGVFSAGECPGQSHSPSPVSTRSDCARKTRAR